MHINQRRLVLRSHAANNAGIFSVRVFGLPSGIKPAAHQRREQDREGLLAANIANEPNQVLAVVIRRRVAVYLFCGFVIVAKLDEDEVAGFDVSQKIVPKPLRDKSPGAASIFGVIPDFDLLVIKK